MKRSHAALAALMTCVGALCLAPASQADVVESSCVVDGVRLLVSDAGESSIVELSVRVRAAVGLPSTQCTIPWYFMSIGAADNNATTPTIALARTFVDHRADALQLADGVGTVQLRGWEGTVTDTPTVVAVRLLVEGTAAGITVDVPRAALPLHGAAGARFEQRVKSARSGQATFSLAMSEGALSPMGPAMNIVPSDAGPAGGVGPASPLPTFRSQLVFKPDGALPTATLPPSLVTLDLLRATLPARILDVSPSSAEAWDGLANAAYAAALHGDPTVASLGVGTLAWLASGLSTHTTRIAATGALPETAQVPESVASAIGDVDARLQRRFGTTARFLPLARPSTFRAALKYETLPDPARAQAAKDAVARLASKAPADLARSLPAQLVDDTAPTDPPLAEVVTTTMPSAQPVEPTASPQADAPLSGSRHRRRLPWKPILIGLALAALAALVVSEQRESP